MALYLLDTGVLLNYVRGSELGRKIDEKYSPGKQPNIAVISIVTVAELKSLAVRLKWGPDKMENLDTLLREFPAVDIKHDAILNKFAEIDAYRTNKHPEKRLPVNMTAKSMGDNDVWISATAAVINATLVTLDNDFSFLNGIFLDVVYIAQK